MKKARIFVPGFFFVDKVIELSNLDLVGDMAKMLDFIESHEEESA